MAFPVPTVGTIVIGNGGSTSVTAPTTALGDLMFLSITGSQSGTGLTFTPPAGWTLIGSANSSNLYAKIAGAGDVGTQVYVVTDTGTVSFAGTASVITVVPGPYTALPTYSHVQSFNSTGTINDAVGITPVELQSILLQFVIDTNTTALRTSTTYAVTNSNPSWNEIADGGGTGAATARNHVAVAYGNWGATSGTATGNCSFVISGSSAGIFVTVHIPGIPVIVTPISATGTINTSIAIQRIMIVTSLILTSTVNVVNVLTGGRFTRQIKSALPNWIDQNKST